MKLWSTGIVRPIRFHDTRHTTATLLLKSGVPLATVQKILRHTDPRLTAEIYGHLDMADMHAGMQKLAEKLHTPPFASETPSNALQTENGFAANLLPTPKSARFPLQSEIANVPNFQRESWRARKYSNLRPSGSKPDALSS